MSALKPVQLADRTVDAISGVRASVVRHRRVAAEVTAQLVTLREHSQAVIARSRLLLARIDRKAATSWPPYHLG